MNKEEERLICYNYNELGQGFGDLIVDIRNEKDKYKQILDKIKEYIEHENFKREILVGVSTKKYTRNILNHILELLEEIE